MRFVSWASLLVGLSMLAQWGVFLATGSVPELQTEPFRIGFHLAAEGLTAVALMAGGLLCMKKAALGRPLTLFANGMLAYTAVVSPGYFVQQGQPVFLLMFGVVLALSVVNFLVILRALFPVEDPRA